MPEKYEIESAELVGRRPPGELLLRLLAEKNWTQQDFAEILGRPVQFISEIIGAKKEITRESAAQISAALDISPEYLLRLQDAYYLSVHRDQEDVKAELDEVRTRAQMNALAPISILRKRRIITGRTVQEQADQIKALFEIADLDETPAFLAAAKRSNADGPVTPTQKAWLAYARRIAEGVDVKPYDADTLESLARGLSRRLRNENEFVHLPLWFADAGVRLVYVEAFPGSRIDAAAFTQGETPVIALSGRGQRLDKVLFALLHEIAHILLGHLSGATLVIDELDATLGSDEAAADELASALLLPAPLPQRPMRIGAGWITEVAAHLQVNPILIIGRLQKRGEIPWRTTLVKDAPNVTRQLAAWIPAPA
jgi:HTH-type transcriptional regulator/antitoxin HigA